MILENGIQSIIIAKNAIIFKNILGLVCNPIAGLVEIPCAKRKAAQLTKINAKKLSALLVVITGTAFLLILLVTAEYGLNIM